MYFTKVLNQFHATVTGCMRQLEKLASDNITRSAKRVNDYGERTITSMRYQGYTSLGFGLAGAACSFTGALAAQEETRKVAEVWNQLSHAGDKVTGTFLGADQTYAQQLLTLERDHGLERFRKQKEEISGELQKTEQSIEKAMEKESTSAAYHSR